MKKVFISYSHRDSDFVDKLIFDLKDSNIDAVYDKLVLTIGDSIIEKIGNELLSADNVIVVLSENSIKSRWVKKELSLALTNELINDKKVLPIKIDHCNLPDSMIDKLYADCSNDYFRGLILILKSINPRYYSQYSLGGKINKKGVTYESLKNIIDLSNINDIKDFLADNTKFIKSLFYKGSFINDVFINTKFGDIAFDFVILNEYSGGSELIFIILGESHTNNTYFSNYIDEMIIKADNTFKYITQYSANIIRTLAMKSNSEFLFERMIKYSKSFDGNRRERHNRFSDSGLDIKLKIILGRRSLFNHLLNSKRNNLKYKTNNGVELISYDRLIQSNKKEANEY